ncbi:hypothetical protein SKAU_G00090230 [Synaphobranchus kaupii]|uniref:Uncharacterized protein n=1 Tax=Synaphobranchus kaupii TaxID=118154 RepID=A0A9Q1FXD6_SYNKA|nr:hypothetical protein SKAU_G00090230 [Synaphobranchus kaupii]
MDHPTVSQGISVFTQGAMPCRPGLWWGPGHNCLLGLTLLLLVCEVITSRLCSSLINMVDSFHTLFIFLRLSLLYLTPGQPATVTLPAASLSSTPTPPVGVSFGTPVSLSPAPSVTPTPASSLYPPAPGSAPTRLSLAVLSSTPSLSRPFGWARVRPLGALISALLLASLCISVSVDIFSHALWPHPTEHPLLVTAVGVVGLLFNTAVLAMGHRETLGLKGGFTCPVPPRTGSSFSGLDGKGEAQVGDSSAAEHDKDQAHAPSFSRTLQDGAFMFYNPGASGVLDLDHHPKGNPPPPRQATIPTSHTFAPWSHPKACFQAFGNPGKPHCNDHDHSNLDSEAPEDATREGQGDSDARIGVCPAVPAGTERPILSGWCHCLPGLITLVQALLGSVLVLANGLVLLQSDPHCLHSVGGCGPLVYLDPGSSALAALVFLAITLPQACRYGYLLLQGTPAHFSLEDLSHRVAGVPGVLAVHDLHVWQLTEAHLVASVHVHCHPGLGAHGCSDLLAGVTEVLRATGVSCSTVQPEFLPVSLAVTGGSQPTGIPLLPPVPYCSLACGAECAGKMCCSPREEVPMLLPSAGKPEDVQPQRFSYCGR